MAPEASPTVTGVNERIKTERLQSNGHKLYGHPCHSAEGSEEICFDGSQVVKICNRNMR